MDPYLLAELGTIAALVPICGAIVMQTVNNFRTAFKFSGSQCVVAAYCLSFFLMFILVAATTGTPPIGFGILTLIFKTVVAGWLAANFAGALADSHTRAQEAVAQDKEEEVREDVPRVPSTSRALQSNRLEDN